MIRGCVNFNNMFSEKDDGEEYVEFSFYDDFLEVNVTSEEDQSIYISKEQAIEFAHEILDLFGEK